MKILFRADGSSKIGTGHIMRCLALAKYFARENAECIFVIKDYDSRLTSKLLGQEGIETILLDKNMSIEQDLYATKQHINERGAGVVITDSYAVDTDYLNELKRLKILLISIDDLADRFFPSDIVLNQNINANVGLYQNRVSENCRLLLGPKFALLREEFTGLEPKKIEAFFRLQVKNI